MELITTLVIIGLFIYVFPYLLGLFLVVMAGFGAFIALLAAVVKGWLQSK